MKTKSTPVVQKIQHALSVRLFGKPAKAYFGSEMQTKVGGAVLMAELEITKGFVAAAAKNLRDWRVLGSIKFSVYQMLWQRVLLICCGYEDAVDGQLLSNDPGLKLALQFDPIKQWTMCRFENGISKFGCYRLAVWLVARYINSYRKPPKEIRLDFDGSCFRTRGSQQGSSYRKFYNTQMLFPIFVFDQDGELITAVLRPGEDNEPTLVVPILKRLVKAFRIAWPEVSITVVMDAAFNDPKIYDWCEDQGLADPSKTVYYLIKLKNTKGGLLTHSHDLAKAAKISFGKRFCEQLYAAEDSPSKNEVEKEIRKKSKKERKQELKALRSRRSQACGEFTYQTGKGGVAKGQWRQRRRILVMCRYDDWGATRTFWVTNIKGGLPEDLIQNVYTKRGEQELRIKDAKSFRCDKMSCQDFLPNQFRLLMHVIAQRILRQFRSLLPQQFQSVMLSSISEHFLQMPAIVHEKSRHLEVAWPANFQYKNAIHVFCHRLETNCSPPWVSKKDLQKHCLSISERAGVTLFNTA